MSQTISMEKVTIPHRVAEEIRTLRIGLGWTNEQVLNRQFLLEEECNAIVNYIDESIENTHKFYLAVTQGYEEEASPAEKVRKVHDKYLDGFNGWGAKAISEAFDAYGIKIKGVNA
jgi:hypothetical protein